MNKYFEPLGQALLDEQKKDSIVMYCMYTILGALALVMTVMNIMTKSGFVTYVTAVFAILSLVNIILTNIGTVCANIAKAAFVAEVFVMFIVFLISGSPEGFSAYWICMLPTISVLTYGRRAAAYFSFLMQCILIFFLWTPFGQSLLLFEYTGTFKSRFPILFLSFAVVSLALAILQDIPNEEVKRLQERYKYMAVRDQLTNVYNRQGLYSALKEKPAFDSFDKIGAVMLDIDFFKNINDSYGHAAGDVVLQEVTKMMECGLNGVMCRWGGEEFVCVYVNDNIKREDLEKLKDEIEKHIFIADGKKIKLTVSMGVCEQELFGISHVMNMIECADEAMYKAKNSGRNAIVYKDCTGCRAGK